MKEVRRLLVALATLVAMAVGSGCSKRESAEASAGKIQQVGLVWLKEEGNAHAREQVIAAVHDFGRLIPEVESAVAGVSDGQTSGYTDGSYDVCFILTFPNEAARQKYNKHPVHLQAAQEVFLPLSRKLLFYRFAGQ